MLGGVGRRRDATALVRFFEESAVVPIGRTDKEPDGDTGPIGEHAARDAIHDAVRRVGSSGRTTERRLGHRPVHRLPGPPEADVRIVFDERSAPEPLEDPGLAPFRESIVGGCGRSVATGESFSRNPVVENEKIRLHFRANGPLRAASSGYGALGTPREDHLDLHPKRVRESTTVGNMKLDLGDRGGCYAIWGRSLPISDQVHRKPSVSRVFGRALRCSMSTVMGANGPILD